jgi:hypothetical protein
MPYGLNDMGSYYSGNINSMPNIAAIEGKAYQYIREAVKMDVENGWELMNLNIGYFPNMDSIAPLTNIYKVKPFIVLYNRYSSTLRVFFNTFQEISTNVKGNTWIAQIQMNGVYSGAFRAYTGYDMTLDQVTTAKSISSMVVFPETWNGWASADFKMSYDPCVCRFNSSFFFTFFPVIDGDYDLYNLDGNAENASIFDQSDNLIEGEYLHGMIPSSKPTGAHISFKSIFDLLENFEDRLKQKNKVFVEQEIVSLKIKQNITALRFIREYAKFKYNNPGYSDAQVLTEMAFLASQENLTEGEYQFLYNGFNHHDLNWFKLFALQNPEILTFSNSDKLLNIDLLNLLFYEIAAEEATILNLHQFYLNDLKTEFIKTSVSYPNVYYKNGDYRILINSGVNMNAPGTVKKGGATPSVNSYPVYNESIGSFAVLREPRIKVVKSVLRESNEVIQATTDNTISTLGGKLILNTQRQKEWTNEYQIKLGEPLKYAINDVLDIEEYQVKAQIVVKAVPKSGMNPANCILNSYHDKEGSVNAISREFNEQSYFTIWGNGRGQNYYHNNAISSRTVFNREAIPRKILDTLWFSSPYVDVNAFNPLVMSIGIKNEMITFNSQSITKSKLNKLDYEEDNGNIIFDLNQSGINLPPNFDISGLGTYYDLSFELKLIVDFVFTTKDNQGQPNKTTKILTYPIMDRHIEWIDSPFQDDIVNSMKNITKHPKNIVLKETVFAGQEVQGCSLIGNQYTCAAYGNLTVSGLLTTDNNYNVSILKGNEVNISNPSFIGVNVALLDSSVYDFSDPMPTASQNYINGYCSFLGGGNSFYRAFSDDYLNLYPPVYAPEVQEDSSVVDFIVFPNPTTGRSYIKIKYREIGNYQIAVTDMFGRQLKLEIENIDDNLYLLNLSQYTAGVYIVTVLDEEYSISKKLVLE